MLLYLNSCQNAGYNFTNINHMIINFISCICHIKYKHYVEKPMSMLERRVNYIISKNPCLIKNTNCPLIRKFPKIPFNNIKMNIIGITDDNDICNCTENDNMIIEISPFIVIIISIIPCFLSIICCV